VVNSRSQAHGRLRIYGNDPDRPTVIIAALAEDNTINAAE
jgi:hypothetical protein